MISHKLKCIFIHINRNGGKSIENAIWETVPIHGSADHRTILYWQNKLDKEKFISYFKFTFCRNPWDRAVSLFHYYKQTAENHKSKYLPKYSIESFEQFISYLETNKGKIIAPTQTSWLKDSSGKITDIFVGRFEKYNADWKVVCNKLGINNELPHLNQSKHNNYKSYYNDVLVDKVRKIYKEDVDFFKYNF